MLCIQVYIIDKIIVLLVIVQIRCFVGISPTVFDPICVRHKLASVHMCNIYMCNYTYDLMFRLAMFATQLPEFTLRQHTPKNSQENVNIARICGFQPIPIAPHFPRWFPPTPPLLSAVLWSSSPAAL